MRALAHTAAIAALLAMAQAKGQTPYPDLTLQDLTWTEGTHHIGVTQKILSPSTPDLPVAISGTADAEFVSGTEVRLRPGFHAGGFSTEAAKFRAYINESLGPVGDVIIISPDVNGNDPYGGIADNVIHVHKWEKVEVGLRLPSEYQDAIDRFFRHYYPYAYPPYPPGNSFTNVAVPGNVVAAHDLNPYADDSLQVVMTLTRPDGSQTMKWGFFMREAKWTSDNDPEAQMVEAPDDPLHPYHIRFRFAPDVEGPWQCTISLKAPHILTTANLPLPDMDYSGFTLVCEPPLPDNNGHLEVNPANRRTLRFQGDAAMPDDETPFFGLGLNMADVRNNKWADVGGPSDHWYGFHKRDFDVMQEAMEQLHDVGGNFMRIWLMRNIFGPEWVNLGVYDAFKTPEVCDQTFETNCENGGWTTNYTGNCQYQGWSFDRMLDQARAKNIYIQLCVEPNLPILDYERFHWGANTYVAHFLEPHRLPHGSDNPLDMKRFFFTPNTPLDSSANVFYWWKRKYKYIMSRWGWSVNVPIIEPFNEIDQTPAYREVDLTPSSCDDHGGTCMENRVLWEQDSALPVVYNDWLTEIIGYVKDPVDPANLVGSPLGESKKLFISGTGIEPGSGEGYLLPCKNPKLDLVDVHASNQNRWDVRANFDGAQAYRNTFVNASTGEKRPFHHGEYTTYAHKDLLIGNDIEEKVTYPFFANYDISFHNELWASAFYGSFAAGTSWGWERVFWWPDAMEKPLDDEDDNSFQQLVPPTNAINQPNVMLVNGAPITVANKPVHHHFRRLSELLNHPNWQAHNFFGGDFSVHRHTYNPNDPDDPNTDEGRRIECYWLLREPEKDLAIGWVHNMNAYWQNSWYMRAGDQNMLGCEAPLAQSITLPGFATGNTYHVTYVPTRLNTTIAPADQEDDDQGSTVSLNLATAPLSGSSGTLLDTLHSDYAFVISTVPFLKSLHHPPDLDQVLVQAADWDFSLFPNPARDELVVQFSDEIPRAVALHDLAGRQVASWSNVKGRLQVTDLARVASGAYWIRVSDGELGKVKKLIIP